MACVNEILQFYVPPINGMSHKPLLSVHRAPLHHRAAFIPIPVRVGG